MSQSSHPKSDQDLVEDCRAGSQDAAQEHVTTGRRQRAQRKRAKDQRRPDERLDGDAVDQSEEQK